jgi:hypothetical protein
MGRWAFVSRRVFKMVGSQLDKMAGCLAEFMLGFSVGDAQRSAYFQYPSEAAF